VSYSSLPDDYIPVIEAASQLAFGDSDYEKHYRRVAGWEETGIPLNDVAGIKRHQQEEIELAKKSGKFYPEEYAELDDLGRTKSYRWECPEIGPFSTSGRKVTLTCCDGCRGRSNQQGQHLSGVISQSI
jgi:hypothetical protein